MKTLVVYASSTGNTRKVAESIHESIQGQKEIQNIDDVESVEGYDLVFVGFPVIGEGMPRKVRRFIGKELQGKQVALFLTHGMPAEMGEFARVVPKCNAGAEGSNVLGTFECQGEMVPWMPKVLKLHPYGYVRRWARMNGESHGAGHPNASDLQKAIEFARSVMEKAE